MKDKSLKQIGTSIIPQGNVPNVPAHLQTGTYYPQTPPPIANPMGVAGMEAQNDMTGFGMGNQMGTYPLAQGDKTDKYAENAEFNKHAMETGISPNFDAMSDSLQIKEMEKFYSNPANVKMMNEEQEKYFKKNK